MFIYDPVTDDQRVATEADLLAMYGERRWATWGGLACTHPAAYASFGGTNQEHRAHQRHYDNSVHVYTPARCSYCGSRAHGDRCDSCGAPQ